MPVLDPNEIFFTAFEPQQAHRFLLYLDGIPSYMIRKVGGLKVSNGGIILNHINVQRKIAGRWTWDDVTMTLYNPITPSGAQAVMEWVRLHHESVTGRDGYSDFYKKDLTINVIGPPGDVVSEWILKGAHIKDATFSDLDWDTENQPSTIDLTVAIDYAVLNY